MSDVRLEWDELRRFFSEIVRKDFDEWIGRDQPHYQQNLEFALSRLEEGRQLIDFLLPRIASRPAKVLDVGAGNGGVSIAFGNDPRFAANAVDITPNRHLIALKEATGIPVEHSVGDARRMPFDDASFDAVTCLETIEHVEHPRAMGSEIMRVLRPGGVAIVTTASRIRHLFRPDPHFGIRGLMFLPDPLQKFYVTKVVKRPNEYDVAHMYWTVGGIARCFPGRSKVESLVNIPYPGIPRTIREKAWYVLRRLLWDRVVITK